MEDQDDNFDPIESEKKELDLLIRKGMTFEVERRWGAGTRKFTIQSPPLAIMDRLSAQYIKLDLDEELMKKNALLEAKHLVGRHARICAKIAAIAVLGRSWKYNFLVSLYAWYFYWRVDSRQLLQLAIIINQMANYTDFIGSIRFLGSVRTTLPLDPSRVEEESEED